MKSEWADNIRFIATVSVIVLHTAATGMYLMNSVELSHWWIANAVNSLVRFGVPFFLMLSGALNLSNNHSIPTFYRKRFFRVFVPFFFWGLIFSVGFFLFYLADRRPESFFHLLKNFVFFTGVFRVQQYHLWFVYVILAIYTITPLIKVFTHNLNGKKITLFGSLFFLITIVNTLNLENNTLFYLFRFAGYTGYYIIGYIFFRYKRKIKINSLHSVSYLIIVAFMALSTWLLTRSGGELNEIFCQSASITVAVSSILLYQILYKRNFSNKIFIIIRDEINKYGYGIFIVHASVLSIIEHSGIDWNFIHPLIGIPLTSIICIFVSYLIIRIMHKIPFLRYVAG